MNNFMKIYCDTFVFKMLLVIYSLSTDIEFRVTEHVQKMAELENG